MAARKRVDQLLNRLAEKERQFLECEFLAPVARRGEVRVRIAQVVCRLRTSPASFQGFGVFRPTSFTRAELARPASLTEKRSYLGLFPLVRLILCRREEDRWFAVVAHAGDRRFRIEGTVPVELAEEAQTFDLIRTRFDGAHFWFDSLEEKGDPSKAAFLRRSLEERVDPERLERSGLTAEERVAYALNYWPLVPAVEEGETREGQADLTRGDPVAERLRASLAAAGARFLEYLERRDSYRVSYTVDGESHFSTVSKGDLTVHSAGICLSGTDRQFDLESLVGVIREGRRREEIDPGEDYW